MRALLRMTRVWPVLCLCLVGSAGVARAQCTPDASHDTTLSVINASSWPITFSIDGMTRATVPPAELSTDFHISPGQHFLRAETSIDGENFSISRRLVIPAGSMCVWTVTNPGKYPRRSPPPLIDPLMRVAFISLAN
jgi:hypothetical protein